jgi:hypothetical protein
MLFSTRCYQGVEMKKGQIGRTCSLNGAMRNAYKVLIGERGWKRPLGKCRSRQ